MSNGLAHSRIHLAALRLFAEKGTSRVTVSELAQAAGSARGTIYNNVESIRSLFEQVAADLEGEMHQRMAASFADVDDPATRLANRIRFFIRRTHEEPHWGRFIIRFTLANASLRRMWEEPPVADIVAGIESGRFDCRADRSQGLVAMLTGTTLTSMVYVLDGYRTWRDAGSDAAALILRALGIEASEADIIGTSDLPPLPQLAREGHAQETGGAAN